MPGFKSGSPSTLRTDAAQGSKPVRGHHTVSHRFEGGEAGHIFKQAPDPSDPLILFLLGLSLQDLRR